MTAIAARGLCKRYRGKKRQTVEALRHLDLDIQKGEVFGFVGPNGAGKSTTIKILTGQITASAGEASLLGKSSCQPACRRNVGYLPENPAFYDSLSARDHLSFVGRIHRIPTTKLETAITNVLERVQLAEASRRPVRGFSKGMVQRLGLAQALLHDPELLILDEPMSGLDPLGRALVKDIIRELKQKGKTIFFSTHIISDVEALCDRVGILVHGRLRALEGVEHLLREGIEGYLIEALGYDGGTISKKVGKEEMKSAIEELLQKGCTVQRIEPQRRTLEDFFLATVKEDYP